MKRRSWNPVAVTVLLTACAIRAATLTSYVDPTFQQGQVQSVAIFPVRNTRMAASEAQQINRRVSFLINQRFPEIGLVNSGQAVDLLNEYGLADDWAVFLGNYVTSGVPDATVLNEIGMALDVDAIIQGEVLEVFQQDGNGQNGVTRVSVRFTMLDTHNGKLLWEASSEGLRKTALSGIGQHAPPVIEAIRLAIDRLVESLPL